MDKYAILLGYFDKQVHIVDRLLSDVTPLDLSMWENGFVFALKTQQLFTALEDLFKQIAKAFENHIEDLGSYYRELLSRMMTEIPDIRPAVISKESFLLLDKVRAFRHFIRHAYDCDLDKEQLLLIQIKLKDGFYLIDKDLQHFRSYIQRLSSERL